jgi:hypothetical protein
LGSRGWCYTTFTPLFILLHGHAFVEEGIYLYRFIFSDWKPNWFVELNKRRFIIVLSICNEKRKVYASQRGCVEGSCILCDDIGFTIVKSLVLPTKIIHSKIALHSVKSRLERESIELVNTFCLKCGINLCYFINA